MTWPTKIIFCICWNTIRSTENFHCLKNKRHKILREKDPVKLPWKDLDIDIVVESTGFFDSHDKAKSHLDAGAKRVVITAPVKDDMALTFTPNINTGDIAKFKITSNASCTTNAITPLISILAKIRASKSRSKHYPRYTATQG